MGDSTPRDSVDTATASETTTAYDESLEARLAAAGFTDEILAPAAVIGRFIVHRALGAGATGVVYAAHDPQLDRTIALKVLRRQLAGRSDARTRFLREAQALARLSHPNVIAVYDVGTAADWTFIAMEYIHGQTFGEWVATTRAGWPAVVAVLSQAGRGLAAAHAAGIVHRDFKPANLLVGNDGRVVVTDLGLARAAMAPADEGASDAAGAAAGPGLFTQPLTRTGAIQGTPAYMAPEQQRGQVADARADQFSFCVTLYEAVFGARPALPARLPPSSPNPLSITPTDELGAPTTAAAPARRSRAASRGRRVPAWLKRAIMRGLSPAPEDRYPSMDSLLAVLSRGTARRRRQILLTAAAAAAIVAGTAVTVHGLSDDAAGLCTGAEGQLAEIWSASARAEMRSAFAASGISYAADSWRRIEPILDGYAGQWATMHTEACRATRVRGEQSELLMDQRMACLDRRRHELAQIVQLLRRPDTSIIEHAVEAAHDLTSIQSCGDLAALIRPVKSPPAAIAAAVTAARQAIAQVSVLAAAGKTEDGLAQLDQLAREQAARDYLPLRAEVSYWTARLAASNSQWERARSQLADALWAAEASGDDEITLRALAYEASALAELDRFKEAHEAIRRGEAVLVRFPTAAAADRVEFRRKTCVLLDREDRPKEALAACQAALDLARRELPPDSPHIAAALGSLSSVLAQLGDYDRSLEYASEALARDEKVFGPDHPELGKPASNVAIGYHRLGRYAEAIPYYQRALVLEERGGPNSPAVANTLGQMATTLTSLKRYAEAHAAFERALAIIDRTLGPDHSSAGALHINFAALLEAEKDYAGAVEHMQRAVAILGATIGTASADYATALLNVCGLEVERNRPRDGLAACQRAMPILEHAVGPDHPTMAQALVTILAPAYAANGQPREAVAAIDRGIAIWPKDDQSRASTIGQAELSLAGTLWDSPPHDRAQARALAIRAHDRLSAAEQAAAEDWLASHR